jgi:hypothetical protein
MLIVMESAGSGFSPLERWLPGLIKCWRGRTPYGLAAAG